MGTYSVRSAEQSIPGHLRLSKPLSSAPALHNATDALTRARSSIRAATGIALRASPPPANDGWRKRRKNFCPFLTATLFSRFSPGPAER